jgi:hypothetical protein
LRLANPEPMRSAAEAGRRKSEIRSPKEIRNPKPQTQSPGILPSGVGFRTSGFFRISDFGFRIWNFGLQPHQQHPPDFGAALVRRHHQKTALSSEPQLLCCAAFYES